MLEENEKENKWESERFFSKNSNYTVYIYNIIFVFSVRSKKNREKKIIDQVEPWWTSSGG